MIDLESLPVDVTKHIHNFRNLLNSSWNSVIDLTDGCQPEDIREISAQWVQATCEIMVGEELLGRKLGIMSLNHSLNGTSILNPEKKPSYVILCEIIKTNHQLEE